MNLLVARMMLKKCFRKAQVVVVSHGGARRWSGSKRRSLTWLLMDMIMPEMDGLQATQQIRQQLFQPPAHMPILALTANANPVDTRSVPGMLG